MVNKLVLHGKKLLTDPQSTVLSAASVIMVLAISSSVLGLVRQRVLAHFFLPEDLSLFFAAFRLPDLIFQALFFGTFSSAFIPVFTKTLKKGSEEAWNLAGRFANLSILLFILLALVLSFSANGFYVLVGGIPDSERLQVVSLSRILFIAQGFFVVSFVVTGVLESLKRFLVPALAPVFYNVGIILGTIFLSPSIGLMAPAVGVVIGAALHFLVQLPFAIKQGFRFVPSLKIDAGIKSIAKLSAPRLIELTAQQISRTVELSLSLVISRAAYTYFTFASTLYSLPVSFLGTSLAKAALPTLAQQVDSPEKFRKTFLNAFYQIVFFVTPIAAVLLVLRIPLVRILFGTGIFGWEATVQTSLAVSAFAFGVIFQATIPLLARTFYAKHDTKTPVFISLITITLTIILDILFVKVYKKPVWGLAAATSITSFIQFVLLFYFINNRFSKLPGLTLFKPFLKTIGSGVLSALVMFVLLKVFDRSVWVKRLSFLGALGIPLPPPFERFVLDTRYTTNLLILTGGVALVGLLVYLGVAYLTKVPEVFYLYNLAKRTLVRKKMADLPKKTQEPITPTSTNGTP